MTTTATTACSERLALRPGVSLVATDPGFRLVRRGVQRHNEDFPDGGDGHRTVLRALSQAPQSKAKVRALLDGDDSVNVQAFLDQLHAGGWLTTTVCHGDRDLYTILPVNGPATVAEADGAGVGPLVLSRFAVARRDGETLVVESPLAWANVVVHDDAVAALVGAMVRSGSDLASNLPADVVGRVLRDLHAAGLLVAPGADDASPDLRQWSPHELWFHTRTRMGNGGYLGLGFGRTNWGKRIGDPVPPKRPPFAAEPLDLHRPDMDALRVDDLTLTAAMEDRRSIREHDDENPITCDQLGELLYRCLRITDAYDLDGTTCLSSPRPSGGSVYELEVYPVVRRVRGLSAGLYHYDSHQHQLRLVSPPDGDVVRVLSAAALAAIVPRPPQVLLLVTARFGRLMRTYEAFPYALVLKHVGVLYQSLYLTATSMGLAACALGAGDPTAFGAVSGVDRTTEDTVGEFMVGSRAT